MSCDTLEYFLRGGWQKKSPTTEGERTYLYGDKDSNNLSNNKISSTENFEDVCEVLRNDESYFQSEQYPLRPIGTAEDHHTPMPQVEDKGPKRNSISSAREETALGSLALTESAGVSQAKKNRSLHYEPQLPIWGMPDFFQTYCQSVVDTYQCPLEFVVGAMMAAVSTAAGNKVVLQTPKYENSLSVWFVAVAPSGSNKSEPIKEVLRPLIDVNNDYAHDYATLMRLQTEGSVKPTIKRIILNDCTPEARVEALKNNPNGLLLYVDELASFFMNLTRYNQNAGATDLLAVYDGRGIQVDRKNGEPVTVEKTFLNMFGTIQPEIVSQIFSKREYMSNGFNQRIMPLFPERVDFPPLNDAVMDDALRMAWKEKITWLIEMPHCIYTLHRESPAYERYYDYHSRLQQLKEEATVMGNGYLSSIYSKLQIQVLRVAGIVHAMWCASGVAGSDITQTNMDYAIECMEYFEHTAKKVMDLVLPNTALGGRINNMQVIQLMYERFNISISRREMASILNISHTTINNALKR